MKAITGASKGRLTKREERINSHEQRNNDGGLNKLNSEDWMKFSLIQEWMKWITN